MTKFNGLPVRVHCTVADCGSITIDRVFVKGRRTLLGQEEFQVYGQMGEAGRSEPVTMPYAAFGEAWSAKLTLEKEIAAARVSAAPQGRAAC